MSTARWWVKLFPAVLWVTNSDVAIRYARIDVKQKNGGWWTQVSYC